MAVELPKTLRIYVSQKDIDGASRGIDIHCPLARAIKRKFVKDGLLAVVYRGTCSIYNKSKIIKRYYLTEHGCNKIYYYDTSKAPFKCGKITLKS